MYSNISEKITELLHSEIEERADGELEPKNEVIKSEHAWLPYIWFSYAIRSYPQFKESGYQMK